jgi:CheY-like chemotaxis protein
MAAKPQLLIVEDNTDHQELFFDAFSPHYDVTFSDTPETCLWQLSHNGFALVILDHNLQNNFVGIELLKKINKLYPKLPVIIVTAYGDEEVAAAAIKSGAVDYIKKTLDNNYIKKIEKNIKTILSQKERFLSEDKSRILDFFTSNKSEFLGKWKGKIHSLKEKIGAAIQIPIKDEVLETLFSSFLADLQNESASVTLSYLKQMIWNPQAMIGSLLVVELLNTSIKEASREIIMEHFPETFEGRARFMQRIGSLVDENDLELSKEYERIVAESTVNMLRMERISTKILLMRTLQHEIRQPLAYIYNSIELLLESDNKSDADSILSSILEQTKRIENLLTELEKDGETPLKDYSDKLPMFDISSEDGG